MRQMTTPTNTAECPSEASLDAVKPHRSIVHRAAGVLTAGLLAFSLTGCTLLDNDSDSDSDDQDQEQTSENEDDQDSSEDDSDADSGDDSGDESDDDTEDKDAADDSDDADEADETEEPADDGSPTDEESSEASGSDTFEGSSGSSFDGSGDGEDDSDTDDYSTDAPDPVSGNTGTSSAEFRDSVQDALDNRNFQEGDVSGVEIYDEEMENGLEITRVIRDFPSPSNSWRLQEGGEVILLYIEPDVGSDLYSSIGKILFLGPEGNEQRNSLLMDSEIEAAGLTAYDPYVDDDLPGWAAFVVDERADSYNLGIVRPETEIIGTDQIFDERVWEFSLSAE